MGRVAGDPEGQRKCILQRAEVPDAIVPVEAEYLFTRMALLERRRQEHEEAKLLVQTFTQEASSHSGSPCVTGLSPEVENENT
ncbi:hypothetical protein NDU88_003805 [Pleurodeles waltl]|uniref:Uncharacterized protein n=1 Tax=Pleurodeles waltl TaxID=8319 RepID=A0AAV7VIV2_PLEWA|nr:hypothetical protein NDU88_003805 [Pleurodeles waltl]